jgi:aspartate kinase
MTPKIVMKFGGTSVGGAQAMRRAGAHVMREKRPTLVTVSAVGGVTDLLLGATRCAQQGNDPADVIGQIRTRHETVIKELELDQGLVDAQHVELERLLLGIFMLRELTPRISDALVSLGERISSRIFAAMLNQMGHRARAYDAWDLGLLTDDQHGRAEPLPDSDASIRAKLEGIDAGVTPVVTGFIAKSTEGEITTLGRGGSDFTAALFGAAAEAEEIQIWTDVPGILRADPKVVEGAQIIQAIRFEEAAELAYFGAKVLHPRTIEPARCLGIPVRVLGTFQVDPAGELPVSEQGTLIHDSAPEEPVRALAIQRGVESLLIHSTGMLEAPGYLEKVFRTLAKHGISVDVVATSEVSVSMTFDSHGDCLDCALEELSTFADVERIPGRSILCVVGSGLRKDTSLLARLFAVLAEHDVTVRVISQGASRINITLVTPPGDARKGMRALHETFF